jgi:hypothetical protein
MDSAERCRTAQDTAMGATVSSAVFLVVGCILMLGPFLSGELKNARLQPRVCEQICKVQPYYCQIGYPNPTTSECYNVILEIKPNGTTCWSLDILAKFTDINSANAYAQACNSEHKPFNCFWDPEDPCTYSEHPVRTDVLLIGGLLFLGIFIASFITCVCIFLCSRRRRMHYTPLTGANELP